MTGRSGREGGTVQITPEMVEAGAFTLSLFERGADDPAEAARAIYEAMEEARRGSRGANGGREEAGKAGEKVVGGS